MKIEINTKEDSHDEIKKVIKMLQHIVGDFQEVFTNEPQALEQSPMANIFGDNTQTASSQEATEAAESPESAPETQPEAEEASQSTEDLFADLFSEEEIKKMNVAKPKEEEEDEEEEIPQSKSRKKYDIEFY